MTSSKKYLLKGDISGIQDFIFNVQSKGAAKTLKAKSYYIEIISELCSNYCISQLQSDGITVEPIYSGGGNFFIKISMLKETGIIKKLQAEINKELLHDDIAIVLTLDSLDEEAFGDSWLSLLSKSNIENLKQQKENYKLFEPCNQKEEEFEQNKKRFASYKTGMEHNDLYRSIVDRLVKSKAIETLLWDENFIRKKLDFKNRLLNKLPFWEDYPSLTEYKAYREKNYTEDNHVKYDKNLIDFDAFGDFAANRTGTNKLAVLKMDVDNLGLIFKNTVNSACEAKELSNQFKDFFDKDLYLIWEQEEFKANIYPVFVGGDDCFIVGAWDKIPYFAKAINDAFQIKFKDKNYSLSAGIIIVASKHPVVSFAELAEDAVSDAKNKHTFSESLAKEGHKKNSIAIFNEIFSWKELDKIIEMTKTITPLLERGELKRSFLDKIRNSAKGFHALQQRILKEGQLDISKLWRLKYYLGKNSDNKNFELIEKLLLKPYETALQDALIKKLCINPSVFPVAARIIELSTKKKLDYAGEN